MLKKILISMLVIIIAISTFSYVTYKKVEGQFENFMISEIKKRDEKIKVQLNAKVETVTEDINRPSKSQDFNDIPFREPVSKTGVGVKKEASLVYAAEETELPEVKETQSSEESSDNNLEAVVVEDVGTEHVASEAAIESSYESDKAKALALAMSKLDIDQITRLIDIASDGFTPEEKQEAKDMFFNNFTEAEQVWILSVYEKHYLGSNGG